MSCDPELACMPFDDALMHLCDHIWRCSGPITPVLALIPSVLVRFTVVEKVLHAVASAVDLTCLPFAVGDAASRSQSRLHVL